MPIGVWCCGCYNNLVHYSDSRASEADWRALRETVHLMSIPGMAESIREGMATPLEDCIEELDW